MKSKKWVTPSQTLGEKEQEGRTVNADIITRWKKQMDMRDGGSILSIT